MNILLVDDDYYIVDTIKSMMNWEQIGIDGIYTALDAPAARQIMEQVPIQIILCDIEMGKESGLDLVEWVRTTGSGAKVIFLTSYADFSYAQKAVKLQSFDYLLKPVQFPKLEELFTKAVETIYKEKAYHENVDKWLKSEIVRRESFWQKILGSETDKRERERIKNLFGIEYRENDLFLYICIAIYDYETIYETLERGMFDFIVRNITEELFTREGYRVETLFRTDSEDASQWNMVLCTAGVGSGRKVLEQLGETYIRQINSAMHSKVSCYVGKETGLDGLFMEVKLAERMKEDDVLGIRCVKFLEDYEEKDIPYVEPSFAAWEELLVMGETEKLLWEINQYEKQLEKGGNCNAKTLKLFLSDFRLMIYSAFHKRGISANRLLLEADLAYGEEDIHSLENMRLYTAKAVKKAVSHMRFIQEEKSVVDIVKDFMEEHMHEDLTREDFAALVYLNGDYLARIFKQETGCSLGNYLTARRMARAKELLANTGQPVNQIAAAVGCTNFSYFAKLFRKWEGMTPNEYRKMSGM